MKLQETYTFISDESEMQKFFDLLPDLNLNETYMLLIQARNKYCPELKGDVMLKRKLVFKKENLMREVKKLEIPYGTYLENGKSIPQKALALYIKITPRSAHIFDSAMELLDAFKKNEFKTKNPLNALLSFIQNRKGKSRYRMYDFDIKNSEYSYDNLLESLNDIVGNTKYHIIETRGGYHLMVDLHNLDKTKVKNMFNNLDQHPYKDKQADTDMHSPIVGGYQGEFVPKIKSYN